MLEHALLALRMYIGMVLQNIYSGVTVLALCILMCICHCIIFILYQEVVCIIYGFGKAHLHHAMAYMPSACIHKAIALSWCLQLAK